MAFSDNRIIKHCPRCQTPINLVTLPDIAMTDPAPARMRLFVIRRCPNCGKRVFFWVGGKQVVE